MSDNVLVTTTEAASVAGVANTTIHSWRRKGLLAPAHHDIDGRYHYALLDVLTVERRMRGRGRPRNSDVIARGLAEVDWPLDHIQYFLAAASEAMSGMEGGRSMISDALRRIGWRGDPELVSVADLRKWVDCHLPHLRQKIIDLAILELAETEARALRARRPPPEDERARRMYLRSHGVGDLAS